MENFNLKKFLTEGKMLKEEVSIPENVKSFLLKLSNNQKSKIQKYDWHDYLVKISPENNIQAGIDYPADEPGALHNYLLTDPEYQQWKDLYNDMDDFVQTQKTNKEIELGNGSTLTLIAKHELAQPEWIIIRK
jgi:hypothetical protein